jgi:putative flippase GtrA
LHTAEINRFSRYVVVGLVAFVIDLTCLLVLMDHMHIIAANTIAFIVANLANFFLAHTWVFEQSPESANVRTYLKVFVVSVFGLAINDAVVWLTAVVIGLPVIVSKVLATGAGLVWNYVARIAWVYARSPRT